MGTKEPGESYENLPKRELQDLSKTYGSSPYNTRSNLVNSQSSNLEKKNLPDKSSAHSTSLLRHLQSGANLSDVADARKGNSGNVNFPGEEDPRKILSQSYDKESHVQISDIRRSPRLNSKTKEITQLQNVLKCDKNDSKCNMEPPKASFDQKTSGIMPQVQLQNEHNSAPSKKPSDSLPYFQYFVENEKGINLFVDLNSSISDWIKQLKSQVCINQNLQNNKFPSFRQEIESLANSCNQAKKSPLATANSETGVDSVPVQNASSRNSIINENRHVDFDQTNEDNGSSGSVAIETKAIDSNVADNSGQVVNLKSDGPESLNALEDQNSKLDNENCDGRIISLESPSAIYSGCSAIGSMEFRLPEVASHQRDASYSPFENNYSLNLVDTVNNTEKGDGLFVNSSEVNIDICENHTPVVTEDWESENPVIGTKASDSPLHNSVEDLASKVRRKRKRGADHEIVNSGGRRLYGRVLRNGKHIGQSFLPIGQNVLLRRRSMRLVSK